MVEIQRRRRPDALRQWVDDRAETYGWAPTLAWATAGGVAAVGLVRLVHMLALKAHPVLAITAVCVVAATAVICLAGLLWAAWRLRLGAADPSPFLLALGISVVTIGICTEAFAGVTTLLWREGLLSAGGPPDLWRTEEYYLWHLVDSIPLLDVQEGFQWPEPLGFGLAGGGLLLTYKVLLIAPLLQIAIGSYRSLTRHFLDKEAKAADLVRRKVLVPTPWHYLDVSPVSERSSLGKLAAVLAVPLSPALPVCVGLLLMPLVLEPGTGLDRLLSGWLGEDLAFLRTAPQWIAAALLLGVTGSLMTELWDLANYMPVRRGVDVILTVGLWLAVIGFVIVAATAVNLALLHVGVAAPARPFPPGEQVQTTLAGFTWQIAAALPGPDIPGTLHWSAPPGFTDRWSSLLVLVSKAAVVGILIAPIARALLAYELHARPRTARPMIGAAAEFAEVFRAARAAVDAATAEDVQRPINAHFHAARATAVATAKLDDIVALFGSGEISAKADAAVGALNRRRETWTHGLRGYGERSREPGELRAEERRLLRSFRTAASQVVRQAGEDVQPSKPAQP